MPRFAPSSDPDPPLQWQTVGLTVLLVALGLGVNWLLQPALRGTRFLLATLVVAVAAQYGGLLPGLLATALNAIIVPLLWFDSGTGIQLEFSNRALQIVLFISTGVALSLVARERRQALAAESQARRQAHEQADRTACLNQFLRSLVESPPDLGRRADIVTTFIADRLADAAIILLAREDRLEVLSTATSPFGERLVPVAVDQLLAGDAGPLRPSRVIRTGQPVSVILPDAPQRPSLMALWQAGVRAVCLVPLQGASGTVGVLAVYHGEPTLAAFTEQDGLVTSIALRAGAALDSARLFVEAKEAVAARDRLVSVVSHDLKNPLHVALMSLDLLQRSLAPTDGLAATLVGAVERACQRMNLLVRDLLDLTRMSAGRLHLRRQRLSLRALATDAASLVAPLAKQKSQHLEVQAAPDLPEVDADQDRLMQVLVNLLDNAIKFTPEGGTICLSAERDGGDLTVAVSDTGPGFRSEDLPRLFERYWQADHTSDQGTGLGLSIAKGLVEVHGGRIWAKNRAGGGATFAFTLPLPEDARQAA